MPLLDLSEKNLNKNILKLCIPVIIENVLHLSVFVTDTIMVGRLGTDAIAAVGLAGTLFFAITMVSNSLIAGAAGIVARHVGAKEKEQAQLVGAQAILMSLVLGMIATPAFVFFADTLLLLMSAEPEVARLGKGYLQAVGGTLVFRQAMLACGGILRGAGDTKTPMKAAIAVNTANILLNWLLIFGIGPFPRLGVTGVGCATAIAYVFGAGLLLAKIFSGRHVLRVSPAWIIRVHVASIRRIVRISIPAVVDSFLTQMGFLFFTKIVTLLGTASLAAHQIAVRIESISFMPGFALAIATATLVGQSLGAKNAGLAVLSMKRGCCFALALMGLFAVVFLVFPGEMAGVFHPEPGVLSMAVACVMIAAIEQPALAVYMVYAGGLRGAGDTLSPMIITVAGTFCFHIPISYLFGITFGWGLSGIWFGAALDWVARAIAIYFLYKRGRWMRMKV